MTSISFAQIFFAIAMIFLPPGKTSKITATMGAGSTEWTLRPDGQWHGVEKSAAADVPIGIFTFDREKQTVTVHSKKLPKDDVTDLSTALKVGDEKPTPSTVTMLGKAMNVIRNGNDLTLVFKDPGDDDDRRKILIHYEQAAVASDPAPATASPAPSAPQ